MSQSVVKSVQYDRTLETSEAINSCCKVPWKRRKKNLTTAVDHRVVCRRPRQRSLPGRASAAIPKELPRFINPLRPNDDESQTSRCNIKGVSVSEVMRIENMITQVQFY